MKTIDNTIGKEKKGMQYCLTVEFHNGSKYCYSGNLKKECIQKFKSKFGDFKGVVVKEWTLED